MRGQLRSVVVKPAAHRVSYKDALVGVRTFRPRFNAAVEARGGWSVERRKVRRHAATVWDRLQPVRSTHDRLGRRGNIHDRLGSKGSFHGRVVGKRIHEHLGARVPILEAFSCFSKLRLRTSASIALLVTTASPTAETHLAAFCAPSRATRRASARTSLKLVGVFGERRR